MKDEYVPPIVALTRLRRIHHVAMVVACIIICVLIGSLYFVSLEYAELKEKLAHEEHCKIIQPSALSESELLELQSRLTPEIRKIILSR